MTGTVTKGLAQRQDLDNYDGSIAASRTNSSGGTTTGLKIGNEVDVLSVYGDGNTSNQTLATINKAISALGSQNVSLLFLPGTWTIDDDLTIAANFTVVAPAGCIFSVSAGKTLTIAGILFRQHGTYTAGSGTVTVSGTDIIPTTDYLTGYKADTGAADAYVIAPSPAITAYAAGQAFSFLAANANTGASTLNVNGLGTKDIKKYDGSGSLVALAANDILVNQIVSCRYDGTQFQLVPDIQPPANAAATDTDNVYTKTETWKKGADVASASALAVDIDGNLFDVTGTTAITSLNSKGVGTIVKLHFDGALTLTHNATDLILPGAANITTAAGDEAEFYEYASGDYRCTKYTRAAQSPGQHIVQRVHTVDNAVATGTTVMPNDDTIPQSSEGDEYITLAITPKNTSNRLMIEANLVASHSAGGYTLIAALFQDATAGALAAVAETKGSATELATLRLRHEMAAGTTSATTFKIRIGGSAAGTTTFNGQSGARLYGGVSASTLTITEIAP